MNKYIPFNKPFIVGHELDYIRQAVNDGILSAGGPFSEKCCRWLETQFESPRAFLLHTCTAALEVAAILCNIVPGDEVIMPSYTFVSTANAFVLRGAKPVFIDIRPDSLCLNETLIEAAITERTKAIVPVHYAGNSCEMDTIMSLAEKYNLFVIEDAAQAVCSQYKGRHLGTIGHFGCYSFHETKNFISGEGGALLVNDESFIQRAEIICDKGTNRSQFFRNEVDKYTWVDIGSSVKASELTAAFLFAQLEESRNILNQRLGIWETYREQLTPLAQAGRLSLPIIMPECKHNAHMFYIILNDLETRTALINHLKAHNILSVFHFVPLHSSPMGIELNGCKLDLPLTEALSDRLLRLPCYYELSLEEVSMITRLISEFFSAS